MSHTTDVHLLADLLSVFMPQAEIGHYSLQANGAKSFRFSPQHTQSAVVSSMILIKMAPEMVASARCFVYISVVAYYPSRITSTNDDIYLL